MATLKIRKVGNSLGVILPKEIQEALNVSEGDEIAALLTKDNTVILGANLPHHSRWKFKEPALTKEDRAWLNADLGDENEP